jgi:hypothetical protein
VTAFLPVEDMALDAAIPPVVVCVRRAVLEEPDARP